MLAFLFHKHFYNIIKQITIFTSAIYTKSIHYKQ